MGKRILRYTRAGISMSKRQKQNSPVDIKKRKKSAYEKEDKKFALPMCEKTGPDSPSGLARTARSTRMRFCLFRRFVFIQDVCLSRRAQRADLFKTSIRLSAILIIFLKNRKTAICKSLTLMKILCEIFFVTRIM